MKAFKVEYWANGVKFIFMDPKQGVTLGNKLVRTRVRTRVRLDDAVDTNNRFFLL